MAKRVCIVGAGPSGLVAAKTLLHNAPAGAFTVTIYDAQRRIGGLWPTRATDTDGLVHPLMVANQSRHTVQFSDLAWSPEDPEFPRAWMIGQYLERYLDRYGRGMEVKLGHRVVKTDLKDDETWSITVESEGGEETSVFDYLLVSSGFFGKPIMPDVVSGETPVPVIHSSKYRDLKRLFPNGVQDGGKILVVGGQMSGVEISGTIATHISAAVNAPDPSPFPDAAKLNVEHLTQRPTWPGSTAAPFLPLDFPSYNLNNRPAPISNSQGHITPDAAKLTHGVYTTALGQDQSEFSPAVAVTPDHHAEPAYLAVSENYMEFVRAGLITVSKGKLHSITGTTATLAGPSSSKIENVAAIVLATGFDPSPCISFLPPKVLETLKHSPQHSNLPLALAFHGTHVKDLPSLGFVGFYRSPYWGVMEMQARFFAALWTPPSLAPRPPKLSEALLDDASDWRTVSLRDDPRTSQFPMGDYPYLMQEFSSALNIPIAAPPEPPTPVLPHNGKPMDILTPARYISPLADEAAKAEAAKSLQQTQSTAVAGLTTSRFVSKAVFRSLLGTWNLERDLTSRLPSHPSGHFSGTAQFLLRDKTADGLKCASGPLAADEPSDDDDGLAAEYLYVEDGEFRADNGLVFRATRRYVWRYDEKKDMVSVWFAKTDDAKRADYLFHEIEFLPPPDGDQKPWQAKAGHLCIDDFYDVKYDFAFKAVNLKEWNLRYTVNGPKKDYTIHGVYRR
ncbi:dimethylaniline monooxygenase [N-oxide-forming] 4 [Colletotrichum spaethianum]|uniref:Dimethylaniline monooxygenase [N-oxide-forming] 4 n=1 Tax=Colletotrichum spaethianum TaxID=700344 RepID=A0AA37NT94_9PEZI|nr:dimethylaniline monooxygenase [N-oxide-forming] 4 [Colletotrichum spaethianum]GKT40597.1 dimethylaniline monooxygenase [N-oxide-forming] 4 [Colletotrichum spaethianum]